MNLERAARAIFFETLKAVDLPTLIRQRIRIDRDVLFFDERAYDLSRFAEVVLIGIGKASLPMGQALEAILGARLTRGVLVTNRREPLSLKSEIIVAGHPVPDAHSLRAGKRAIDILANGSPNALVIFLISGGGSSLFELPLSDEITLEDLQELNRILVECGATISEINVVRKQFSAVKGGKLRKWMRAAEAVALFASDVNAGDLKTLASNPLFPEAGTAEPFRAILEKYTLEDRLPRRFQQMSSDRFSADLKIDDGVESNLEAMVLAENADVVRTAGRIAGQLGYKVWCDRTDNEEGYQDTAARLIAKLTELKEAHPDHRVCVISGGEVACPVKGQGFGGRNQEFALHCAMKLGEAALSESVVLSCGTDGVDGRSIAVGAVARAGQMAKDQPRALYPHDYFEASDTTSWFNQSGGLIVTGPTGNNLRDLRLILAD